eukprot:109275_1
MGLLNDINEKAETIENTATKIEHFNGSFEDNNNKSNQNDNSHLLKLWLRDDVKLPIYYSNFVDNGYEQLEFVKEIKNDKQLSDIDIKLKGHQGKILSEIKKLQKQFENDYDDNNVVSDMNCDCC